MDSLISSVFRAEWIPGWCRLPCSSQSFYFIMVEFLDELITLGHCLCRRYLYTTRMGLQYSLTPDPPDNSHFQLELHPGDGWYPCWRSWMRIYSQQSKHPDTQLGAMEQAPCRGDNYSKSKYYEPFPRLMWWVKISDLDSEHHGGSLLSNR